jgi:Na+-translocating ferredoxin:NAD+ oxidoreductase RnfC subunit
MKFQDFKGGVHPSQAKNTMECATIKMSIPEKVVIPMVQHIGAPCQVLVKKGDAIKVGQVLGNSDAFVSVPVHSSVSGTVTSVTERIISGSKPVVCVEIKPDGLQEVSEDVKAPVVDSKENFLKAIRDSGLTGLGGAGFPAHVKLNPPKDARIDTLIINGAECEPYITSDYRECMENTENIIEGINHVLKWTGIPKALIGIEDNRAERSMKTYVIGRKNWLFNNTQNGARASAIYYSIVVTAIENGLNPYEYLTWIFTHAPNIGRPGYVTEIGDFLPGSTKIPQNVYIPKPKGTEPEKYAWEED